MSSVTPSSQEQKQQQKNLESGTESTLMSETNLNISEQKPQESQEYHSKDTYHQSCETLLYWDFAKTMIDKDYSRLIISGNPSEEILKRSFELILQEYVSIIHTDKSDSIVTCYLKLTSAETKMMILENALTYLRRCEWDNDIAEAIQLYGYDYIEPLEDEKAYLKQIELVSNEIKVFVILINEYRKEYLALTKSDGEEKQKDLLSVEEELAILGKFQNSRIDKKVTTVLEFVAILNNYIKYNNALRTAIQ